MKKLSLYLTGNYRSGKMISLQIKKRNKIYVFVNSELCTEEVKTEEDLRGENPSLQIVMISWNIADKLFPYHYVFGDTYRMENNDSQLTINLVFYSSIKTVLLFLGEQILDYACRKYPKNHNTNYLLQKGKIDGTIVDHNYNVKIRLRDRNGWVQGGLDILSITLCIDNPNKKKLVPMEKKEMNLEQQKNPKENLSIDIVEIELLSQTEEKFATFLNQIIKKIGLENYQYDSENPIPGSIGKIVATLLEKRIKQEICQAGNFPIEQFEKLDKKILINKHFQNKKKDAQNSKNKISGLLSGGSVQSMGFLHSLSSGCFNALVSGGRTHNEDNTQYLYQNTADIDFISCYGTALTNFYYPIGLPTVKAYTDKETRLTLRQFLEKYEAELVENLYTITISGNLTYQQNLLYSKLIKPDQIMKKMLDLTVQEEILEEINADFVILQKELKNTILTSDLLTILRKTCSLRELKEIYDCQVITSMYYSQKNYIEKENYLTELQTATTTNEIFFKYNEETQSIEDKRPRTWSKVPLESFVGPLIKMREAAKAKKDPTNDSLNKILKLIVNTVYGVISSPYFSISNTVLANVITARARGSIWLLTRPLQGIQSITDGSTFPLDNVIKLKTEFKRNPSLSTLSSYEKLRKHRNVIKTTIENISWKEVFEDKTGKRHIELEKLDEYTKNHVRNFWDNYGLTIPYLTEIKKEHFSSQLFAVKKAHYVIERLQILSTEGETKKKNETKYIYKFRGVGIRNEDKNEYDHKTNKKTLPFWYIVSQDLMKNEENAKTSSQTWEEERETTVNDYIDSQQKETKLLPGETIQVIKTFKFTNEDMNVDTEKEYNSLKRNVKDYASMFKTHTVKEVLTKRIKEQEARKQKTKANKNKKKTQQKQAIKLKIQQEKKTNTSTARRQKTEYFTPNAHNLKLTPHTIYIKAPDVLETDRNHQEFPYIGEYPRIGIFLFPFPFPRSWSGSWK